MPVASVTLSSRRPVSALVSAALVLVLAFWLVVKVRLFDQLAYTSDGFMWLQASQSWLRGRPILFNNFLGAAMAGMHSAYLVLLLGPLALALGAKGLFLSSALVQGAAAWSAVAGPAGERPTLARTAVGFTAVLGPVAFWLWDDPVYGWHPETLFFPLAVLFGLALARRQRSKWLWGGLLLLLREDGAVVACCAHLLCVLGDDALPRQRRLRLAAKVAGSWFALFVLVMLWLQLQNSGTSRLQVAVRKGEMLPARQLLDYVSPQVAWWLLLAVVAVVPLLARGDLRRAAIGISLTLPLAAIGLVAGLLYTRNAGAFSVHAMLWPPRLAAGWGIASLAALLPAPLVPGERSAPTKYAGHLVIAACAVGVILQLLWLHAARDYDVTNRVRTAFTAEGLPITALQPAERRFLRCVERTLPRRTPVTTEPSLFRYFERHDLIWATKLNVALAPPELAICDGPQKLLFSSSACETVRARAVAERGFVDFDRSMGDLRVGAAPAVASVVKRCAGGAGLGVP